MKWHIEATLTRRLVSWVDGVRRNARAVSIGTLLATALLAIYTVLNLGIDADPRSLIAETLPARVAHAKYVEHFPNLENAADRAH